MAGSTSAEDGGMRDTTLTTEWSWIDEREIVGRQRWRQTGGLVAFTGLVAFAEATWSHLISVKDAERRKGEAFILQWLNWGCDEEDGEGSKDDVDYINIKTKNKRERHFTHCRLQGNGYTYTVFSLPQRAII